MSKDYYNDENQSEEYEDEENYYDDSDLEEEHFYAEYDDFDDGKKDRLMFWVVIAALINFIIAGFIIANLVFFDPASEVDLTLPPTQNDGSSFDYVDTNNNETETEVEDDKPTSNKTSEKNTLNETELSQLATIRNPFGNPPQIESDFNEEELSYQERLDYFKQKMDEIIEEELLAKEQEEELERIRQEEIEEARNEQNQNNQNQNTPGGDDDEEKSETLTRSETKTIVDKFISQHNLNISSKQMLAVIEASSDFDPKLVSSNGGVRRIGITQFREEDGNSIANSLGTYYRPSLSLNPETNIQLGANHLNALAKENDDPHYAYTAYWLGKQGADIHFQQYGHYRTDFSNTVLDALR